MEGREGFSQATAGSLQAMGPAGGFSSMLQRTSMQSPTGIPSSLHAPAAMRPSSTCPNQAAAAAAPYTGDTLVPHLTANVGMGVSMAPTAVRGAAATGEPVKRKRGRPRKYGDAGSGSMALALTTTNTTLPASATTPVSPATEKRRGRPPGTGKKQQLAALGSAGQGFTPHVITIAAGEDVATKIMSFSQTGQRAVCVLSANGAISNVTLRQAAASGGTVTYEGRFEILSLSGSFLLSESGGTRSRTGGLSVSLAGPDGSIVGGGVAGLLMAASPVQVVVGSFIADTTRKVVVARPGGGGGGGDGGGGGGGGGGTSSSGVVSPLKNDSRSPDSQQQLEQQHNIHLQQQQQHQQQHQQQQQHRQQQQQQQQQHQQMMGWGEQRPGMDINISLPSG